MLDRRLTTRHFASVMGISIESLQYNDKQHASQEWEMASHWILKLFNVNPKRHNWWLPATTLIFMTWTNFWPDLWLVVGFIRLQSRSKQSKQWELIHSPDTKKGNSLIYCGHAVTLPFGLQLWKRCTYTFSRARTIIIPLSLRDYNVLLQCSGSSINEWNFQLRTTNTWKSGSPSEKFCPPETPILS